MSRRVPGGLAPILTLVLTTACAQNGGPPLSPSAAVEPDSSANPDGSTLKVTAPVIVSPRGGTAIDTRRPELVFTHATGRFVAIAPQYRLEAFDDAGTLLLSQLVNQGGGTQTTWAYASDLPFDTVFAWRVRAELDGQAGPWSATESFRTPAAPPVPVVGPPRSIGIGEAFALMVRVHDELRFDLGSRSTRDSRVAFWSAAVAVVHYGHPRFNPAGPDAGWCIKDAGGGRPLSDDVIVRCGSRDFWDLIGGVGADGYVWRIAYDGILPRNQNVYPPPRSALDYLNR